MQHDRQRGRQHKDQPQHEQQQHHEYPEEFTTVFHRNSLSENLTRLSRHATMSRSNKRGYRTTLTARPCWTSVYHTEASFFVPSSPNQHRTEPRKRGHTTPASFSCIYPLSEGDRPPYVSLSVPSGQSSTLRRLNVSVLLPSRSPRPQYLQAWTRQHALGTSESMQATGTYPVMICRCKQCRSRSPSRTLVKYVTSVLLVMSLTKILCHRKMSLSIPTSVILQTSLKKVTM